jgi:calnexin
MQNDILFDNIYIGHSIEDAEKLRKETFDLKHPVEVALEEASQPKPEEKGATPSVSFKAPVTYVREKVDYFVGLAKQDPINAVKQVPEVAGGLGALLLTMILIIVGAVGASSPAPAAAAKKGKEAASAAKEKASEAVSSAADTAKGAATKRNTRSSAQ